MTTHREVLLGFLDLRLFTPTASADSVSLDASDRKLLKRVQKRVHETRIRYVADYSTPAEIKTNFIQDLNSKPGQALASDMLILGLPRFEDVRQDFLALCKTLGL